MSAIATSTALGSVLVERDSLRRRRRHLQRAIERLDGEIQDLNARGCVGATLTLLVARRRNHAASLAVVKDRLRDVERYLNPGGRRG